MKTPMEKLWDEMTPMKGACPAPRPRAVADRVNAALDAAPTERTRYMKIKLRTAAVLAAALVLLATTAVAAVQNWTVLDAYFGGNSQVGETIMDDTPRSVSDKNYTLTVDSSVGAGKSLYLLVTVTGNTPEAVEYLQSEAFMNMDTFSFWAADENGKMTLGVSSVSMGEEENLRTETSRTYHMDCSLRDETVKAVSLRLGCMEEDLRLEIPYTPAETVTVAVDAKGQGVGTLFQAAGAPLTLHTVELTPLGVTMTYTQSKEDDTLPLLSFLYKDGSIKSWGEMLDDSSLTGRYIEEENRWQDSLAFREVQDLSRIKAVAFDGTAYPLDGSKPYAFPVPAELTPKTLPLGERVWENQGGGYSVPVRALCDALGASCDWDEASRSVTATYRDVTIVLTEGKTTALVNGQAVEQYHAPVILNGQFLAEANVFADYWKLDMCAAYENPDAEDRIAWIVIP